MEPKIYTSQDHHIRNDLIDPNALTVLKKLHDAGYKAYLVGGGVRDLLMRKRPKDFDISTSAKPEEVKEVFRNCILIGRRFRLAHVRFGKEIIEVSTFRSGDPSGEELILRDNIWGTPEEDVMRRDFTINGLFYDPLDHQIIDYVGGFEDLKEHKLRVIGDPIVRFKQDPVRMIRLQKFRARFGFNTEPGLLEALESCKEEILKSSQARVMEEFYRMLESGAAEPFFRLLNDSGLLHYIFPTLSRVLSQARGKIVYEYLKAADTMNVEGNYRTLDRSILTAAIVYPLLEREVLAQPEEPHLGKIIEMTFNILENLFVSPFIVFPRRIKAGAHAILQMQFRIIPLNKNKKPKTRIVFQKHFKEALIFIKLRALIHHELFKIYEHWRKVLMEAEEREKEYDS